MTDLLAALGVDPGRLVKGVFEANLLLLFFVCLCHSLRSHGWRRTFREFTAGFALTALAESTGVLSGAYVYPGFEFYVLATPVANPASWVALLYIIMEVSNRLVFGPEALADHSDKEMADRPRLELGRGIAFTILALALVDASLALIIDLVLDPLATVYNWWIWVPCREGAFTVLAGDVVPYNFDHLVWMNTPENPVAVFFGRFFEGGLRYPTRLLGIPLINFIAWFVFVFVYALQFRWVESRAWGDLKRTIVLWGLILVDTPILALLLIAPNL